MKWTWALLILNWLSPAYTADDALPLVRSLLFKTFTDVCGLETSLERCAHLHASQERTQFAREQGIEISEKICVRPDIATVELARSYFLIDGGHALLNNIYDQAYHQHQQALTSKIEKTFIAHLAALSSLPPSAITSEIIKPGAQVEVMDDIITNNRLTHLLYYGITYHIKLNTHAQH